MSTPANSRPRITLNLSKDRHESKFPKLKLKEIKYNNQSPLKFLATQIFWAAREIWAKPVLIFI